MQAGVELIEDGDLYVDEESKLLRERRQWPVTIYCTG